MRVKIVFFLLLLTTFSQAQIINIPDTSFKNMLTTMQLSDNIAKNSSGVSIFVDANHNNEIEISEALVVYELRLSNCTIWNNSIQSLEGLQYFTNLKVFENIDSDLNSPVSFVGLNNLEYIDISGNYDIRNYGVTVSGLINLKTLKCRSCNLSSINLSGLNNLIDIDFSYNHLTSINLDNLSLLKKVDLKSNQITGIPINTTNVIEDLNLWGNRLTSFNASLFPNLKYLDCSGNRNMPGLNFQNHPNLTKLTCNDVVHSTSSTFFNLTGCINLQEFYCNDNYYLTNISLQGLNNLKIVELKFSNITNVDVSNLTNLELLNVAFTPTSGYLNINIQGCSNFKNLQADSAHLTSLNASNLTNLETIYCGYNNSLSSVNLTNCTALKYATFYSTLLTTLDFSNSPNLLELDCHNSRLTNLNLQSCSLLRKIDCSQNNNLTFLDLSCSRNYTTINFSSCSALTNVNLKNGFIDNAVFNTGYTPNLRVVGVDFNENFSFLPITVSQTPYLNFTPNCKYNTVIGNVKLDMEGNGCQDNSGIENIKIKYIDSYPQPSYAYSNSQGDFTIFTKDNSVSITPLNDTFPLWDFGLTNPINLNFTPANNLLHIDLCLAPNTVHQDLEITILPIIRPIPGFDTTYKIIYRNKGNQIQSGTVNFTFNDAVLDLISANPYFTNQTTNLITWDFTNLLPFETRELFLTFNLNSPVETPSVTSGFRLNYNATISSTVADETPADNSIDLTQIVTNSYDPNDKTCLEGSTVSPSKIGDYVHYMVRFENTGTANAITIVVRDIIDASKFEISSLVPIKGSHPFTVRILDTNKVEFIFQNINLPFDDANNDGYVVFKIKTKSNLVVGNTFSNSANIYFDYNAPIVTNTYTTSIQTLSSNEIESQKTTFSVYPNPVKNYLFFKTEANTKKVEIFDINGRILNSIGLSENKVDLSKLKSGAYVIRVYTENEVITSKIIKE